MRTYCLFPNKSLELSPAWEVSGYSPKWRKVSKFYGTRSFVTALLPLCYRFHQCPPLVPILSQMNPIHTQFITSIHILVVFTHLSSRLPTVRATQLYRLIPILISVIISICSNYAAPHHTYYTYNHLSSSGTLFRTASSHYLSFNVTDQVSDSCETKGRVNIL